MGTFVPSSYSVTQHDQYVYSGCDLDVKNAPLFGLVYSYGAGLAEGVAVRRTQGARQRPVLRRPRGEGDRLASAARVGRRRYTRVRRLVMASGCDHLLTLTFHQNVTDLDLAWSCWRAFVREVRKRWPGFVYIVTWERQRRGAIHFHAAVKGFYPVQALRAIWRACTPDCAGNVDMQWRRALPRATIARYIAKYATKDYGLEALNRRRMASSRNIVLTAVSVRCKDLEDLVDLVQELSCALVRRVWRAPDAPVLWCATW